MATTTTATSTSTAPARDAYPIPEIQRGGMDSVPISTSVPTDATQVTNPTTGITPDEFNAMKDQYGGLKQTLEDQILKIANAPIEVDTNALVGELNTRFSNMKNRITESALQSVKKAGLDLDTYFGSPTGDQRSGARAKMAANVKNSMMQSAFQSIAQVYDKNSQEIISTQLEGAKINIQAAATKAQAIASFTNQATSAYLGVLSETNKNYASRLSASVEWSQIQAQSRGQDIQFASAMKQLEVSQRGQDLQSLVSQRGQELDYSATTRGQDIQREISFAQLKSQAEQMQLEKDKAMLAASVQVWSQQGKTTQQHWVPTWGGTPQSLNDLGSWSETTKYGSLGSRYTVNEFTYKGDSSGSQYSGWGRMNLL